MIQDNQELEGIHLGRFVSVHEDRVEHIKKHRLNLPVDEIVELADRVTKGKEGIHVFHEIDGRMRTIVVRGISQIAGKEYGIVRTIWDDNAGENEERTGLKVFDHNERKMLGLCKHIGLIPYIHGCCPFCGD